jgi:CheY-like chemotaxis protein
MYEIATASGTHAVQFYQGEPFLHRAIVAFLMPAIRRGEPIAMVARRRTFEGVADTLSSSHDRTLADAVDRLVFVDGDVALPTFMDGLTPDPERFGSKFGELMTLARRDNQPGPVWIYGEMVDLLCQAGNHAGALRIEELWNAMTAGQPTSVMCGYAIQEFDHDVHATTFQAICRQHTHVFPTETFTEAPDDRTRLEQVALLEQRARALAHQPPIVSRPGEAVTAPMIYVIDDDTSMRRSLARLLSAVDFHVETFASAEEFLASVRPDSGGCLIVDAQLVGMSGSELQSRMASANWRLPVIAMSGSHDQQIESEAVRLGASAFLSKPFDAQALLDAIARALTRA